MMMMMMMHTRRNFWCAWPTLRQHSKRVCCDDITLQMDSDTIPTVKQRLAQTILYTWYYQHVEVASCWYVLLLTAARSCSFSCRPKFLPSSCRWNTNRTVFRRTGI